MSATFCDRNNYHDGKRSLNWKTRLKIALRFEEINWGAKEAKEDIIPRCINYSFNKISVRAGSAL